MMLRKWDYPLSTLILFVVDAILHLSPVSSFPNEAVSLHPRHTLRTLQGRQLRSKPTDGIDKDQKTTANDALTKASWYAVEAFGKVFGSGKLPGARSSVTAVSEYSTDEPPASLAETLARLRADNDREYFLSGQVDELLYDPDCVFADPFVEFRGRDRFVENLANLGSFITEYSAKPIAYQVDGNAVETKFMVKLRLNLPWKPVLAWPWGVRCKVDERTNLIVLHRESWDIEPWEGVKQIFRKPTSKVK